MVESAASHNHTQRAEAHRLVSKQHPPGSGIARSLVRVCWATDEALDILGSAVIVMTGEGNQTVAAASSDWSRAVASLEVDLGEGPAFDAVLRGREVAEPDLLDPIEPRWLGFSAAAVGRATGAAYSFPLQMGGSRLGALSLYHDTPRVLDRTGRTFGAIFAEIATCLLLEITAPTDDRPSSDVSEILAPRTEVFQAQGMVMVALRVDLTEALVRMRAYAFASGRTLESIALDIVESRLDPGVEMI